MKRISDSSGRIWLWAARLLTAVFACLLVITGSVQSSDAILKYSDVFNRCVFEITTDSHANGWDKAEFEVDYYDKNGKAQRQSWDITDEMSEGETITLELNKSFARPYKINFYMEFGGGFTVRNQSGKIKYTFQNNTVMEEEYSAWSLPFSSYEEWTTFYLPEVPIISLIDDATGIEREMESLATAFTQGAGDRKQTIRLLTDVELTAPIDVSSDNITLDLNGFAIKRKNVGENSTLDGRMFYIEKNGKLNIIDSKSDRENSTKYKGGVLIDGLSENDGGCFYIEYGGSLSMTGCTISNCDTKENGGAIYCEGELALDGTKINYCDAKENGGAIALAVAGAASLKNVTIDDCDSDEKGGALVLTGNIEAELQDVTIVDCDADDYGGAVYMTDTTDLIASGLTIRNCKAEYGGAIYDESGCKLLIEKGRIEKCRAEEDGGGMYYQAGWLKMTDCEWNGCYAGGDGGCIYLITRQGGDTSQSFIRQDFENCEAGDSGGVIYVIDDAAAGSVGPTNLQNCIFRNNKAKKGGAVYLESFKVYFINTSVTNNTATGNYGGGVYVDSLKDIEVAGKVVIRDNRSSAGTDNLSLQNGMASAAKLYSGGLYDGSYIGISSTSGSEVTIANGVSIFNAMKYIHSDETRRTIRTENTYAVMTPLVASIISENASILIIIAGLVLLVIAVLLLRYRKRRKWGTRTDG